MLFDDDDDVWGLMAQGQDIVKERHARGDEFSMRRLCDAKIICERWM